MPENTISPLAFRALVQDGVMEAILRVCKDHPTPYSEEVEETIRDRQGGSIASFVASVEHVLWLAESRRAIERQS